MNIDNKKPKGKMKVSIVEESQFGLYVWVTEQGGVVMDEDGNYLNIPAMKGDQARIELLRQAAKDYGVDGGSPRFFSGYRRVTDEEREYQEKRLALGLIPDELDLPAFQEELRHAEIEKRRGYGKA